MNANLFRIVDRRANYGRRTAHIRFADPLEFLRRFNAGMRIQLGLHKPRAQTNVLTLRWRKAS